jgi:2',3'-cyclic-nucleotide 2'-phosphodiesterase/3'-nucleotidase
MNTSTNPPAPFVPATHTTRRALRLLLAQSLFVALLLAASVCGAREVAITILTTTDLHGNVLPTTDYEGNPDLGGLARCATKIGEIRREQPNTLLVDAGDTIQGTAASFMSDGLLMVKLLNHLKYDAWVLGNHEFDWGLEKLAPCVDTAVIPVLAANLRAPDVIEREAARTIRDKTRRFIVTEVDGVKVGIIGLSTPGIPNWSRPRLIAPLEFEQSVDALRRVIPEVRKQGAHIIVLVAHQGWREGPDDHANQIHAIAYRFPEIDIIIGGHTHQNVSELLIPPALRMLYCQAGHWGIHLGRVDLRYDTVQKKLTKKTSQTLVMDKSVALAPDVLELSRAELDAAELELKTVIGEAEKEFSPQGAPKKETPIHNLISEAIAEALQKQGAPVDAVIHGVLNDRGALKPGPLSVADAWEIVPYENTIGVFEVTPAELKEVLEENANHYERGHFRGVWGIRVAYRMSAPRNTQSRVVSITDKDGNPFPPERRIRVAANSYDLASGGKRFPELREIAERPTSHLTEFDFQTRQALIDYIKAHKLITPRTYGWWATRGATRTVAPEKPVPLDVGN